MKKIVFDKQIYEFTKYFIIDENMFLVICNNRYFKLTNLFFLAVKRGLLYHGRSAG